MKNTLETWLLTTKWQWWGVGHDGTESWIGRHSWGSYWGDQGFFYIQMHYNNLGIETDCECLWSLTIPLTLIGLCLFRCCVVSTISSLHCFNRLESSNCCWKYPPFLPCSGRPIDSADSDRKQYYLLSLH